MHRNPNQKNRKLKPFADQTSKHLFKPSPLPIAAENYLIVQLGHNHDWVRRVKCVMRLEEGMTHTYEIRVFDELLAYEKRVKVLNYHSLDPYPELIIYEGWIDTDADIALLKK